VAQAAIILFGECLASHDVDRTMRDLIRFSVTPLARSIVQSNKTTHPTEESLIENSALGSSAPSAPAAASAAKKKAGEDASTAATDGFITTTDLALALKNALTWWNKYYFRQDYERRFVESQTGLPFATSEAAVKAIGSTVVPVLQEA
jgi:hypothetical protein